MKWDVAISKMGVIQVEADSAYGAKQKAEEMAEEIFPSSKPTEFYWENSWKAQEAFPAEPVFRY